MIDGSALRYYLVCVCVCVCVCVFVCLCATIDYETYGRQIDAIILTIADRQIRLFIQVDTTKSMKEKYVGLVETEIKCDVFYTKHIIVVVKRQKNHTKCRLLHFVYLF